MERMGLLSKKKKKVYLSRKPKIERKVSLELNLKIEKLFFFFRPAVFFLALLFLSRFKKFSQILFKAKLIKLTLRSFRICVQRILVKFENIFASPSCYGSGVI